MREEKEKQRECKQLTAVMGKAPKKCIRQIGTVNTEAGDFLMFLEYKLNKHQKSSLATKP